MSTNTTEGNQFYPHDLEAQSTEETITALVEIVEEQQQQIDELTERIADLEDEQDDQEDDLQEERAERAKEDAQLRQRITAVEDEIDQIEDGEADSGDENPTLDGEETSLHEPQTPLEDLVTLPDAVLDGESANTQRAVFVARDVAEYSQSVPAGRAITSSDLRTVLRAGTDSRGHRQTVARVMDLLDDLGGEDVKIVDRRGTKRLVFSDEIVSRLEALTRHTEPSRSCDAAEA